MGTEAILLEPDGFGDIPTADEYDDRPPCEHFDFGDEPPEEGGACIPPWELEPQERTSAPFVDGLPAPHWPVETLEEDKVVVAYRDVRKKWHGQWGRHIGAKRQGSAGEKKHHAGVDLYADEGDVVRAMEGGEVIAQLPFHHGTWAVYVRHDSGPIVNYGEVEKGSWTEFGFPLQVLEGETQIVRVEAGDPLARIGRQSGGGTMLHLETYEPQVTLSQIRARELQWSFGETAPPGLADPTFALLRAQQRWYMETEPIEPTA